MLGRPSTALPVLLWMFVLGGLVPRVSAQQVSRDDPRPVAVLAIANADRLLSDASFLAQEMAGPGAQGALLFAGAWLQGVDRTRPLGVLFYLEDQGPRGIGFLPVQDFERLRKRISEKLGEPEDTGSGIFCFRLGGQTAVYYRHVDPWVFIADARHRLIHVPREPVKYVGEWRDDATVALHFDLTALSKEARAEVDELVAEYVQALNDLPAGRGIGASSRRKLQELQLQTIQRFVRRAESWTLGFRTDRKNQRLSFHLTLVLGPDSEEDSSENRSGSHNVPDAGVLALRQTDAALTFFSRYQLNTSDRQTWKEVVTLIEGDLMGRLATAQEDGSSGARSRAFVEQLFEQLQQTIDEGALGLSGTLWLQDNTARFGIAVRVADGKAVERSYRDFVEQLPSNPSTPQAVFDVGKVRGVRMHQLKLELPENEKEARLVFGPQLVVTFGFGAKTVYVVLGHGGEMWLKEQLTREDTPMPDSGLLSEVVLSLRPLLQNLPETDEAKRAQIRNLARLLESPDGKAHDRIRLAVSRNRRAIRYDLEIDTPILRLLQYWSRRAAQEESSPR
ncbi:MAG TPA: hypothetical protein ENJ16_05060 [Planctomycetaceae bacterium]|nr:hypothetical protein [Planctomycetaceae bacterium]